MIVPNCIYLLFHDKSEHASIYSLFGVFLNTSAPSPHHCLLPAKKDSPTPKCRNFANILALLLTAPCNTTHAESMILLNLVLSMTLMFALEVCCQ